MAHYAPLVALVPAGSELVGMVPWWPLQQTALVAYLVAGPVTIATIVGARATRSRCARCDANLRGNSAGFAYHNRGVARVFHWPPIALGAVGGALIGGMFVVSPIQVGVCMAWMGVALLVYVSHVHGALKVEGLCPTCLSFGADNRSLGG